MKMKVFSILFILVLLLSFGLAVPVSANGAGDVYVDIKPGSCPNSFNVKGMGNLSVAILGTGDFEVTTVAPETISLVCLDGFFATSVTPPWVSPLRWAYEDVATPYTDDYCDCHELEGDGYLDLVLKFKSREVVDTLGLLEYGDGDRVMLGIMGSLLDGTCIQGDDCVKVVNRSN